MQQKDNAGPAHEHLDRRVLRAHETSHLASIYKQFSVLSPRGVISSD